MEQNLWITVWITFGRKSPKLLFLVIIILFIIIYTIAYILSCSNVPMVSNRTLLFHSIAYIAKKGLTLSFVFKCSKILPPYVKTLEHWNKP